MIVENVRGAQKWVGRSNWNFGSYHLWGDVPALMPIPWRTSKMPGFSLNPGPNKWGAHTTGGYHSAMEGLKEGGDWWNKECRKTGMAQFGSKSKQRRAASAEIAKIPFPLAQHIARTYYPDKF